MYDGLETAGLNIKAFLPEDDWDDASTPGATCIMRYLQFQQ